MDKLYYSIEISKALDDFKQIIKYYIIKEDSYGFKITKQESNDLIEKDVLIMKNVIDTENYKMWRRFQSSWIYCRRLYKITC